MLGHLDDAEEDAFLAHYQSCNSDETPYVLLDVRTPDGPEDHLVQFSVQDSTGTWHNKTGLSDPDLNITPNSEEEAFEVWLANDNPGPVQYEIRYETHCRDTTDDGGGGGGSYDDDDDGTFDNWRLPNDTN